MEVRVCRASAAIVQRVPAAAAAWFLEWQRGVSRAAEGFAGYEATDVYPVSNGRGDEWVVVLHFADDPSLQRWLASDVRARWVEKLRAKLGDFTLKKLPGGFGLWLAGLPRAPQEVPPSWKVALTVLLALYPTAMLLTILVGPYTTPLGAAVAMLVGNALSVPILQWGVMPALTAALRPWLRANERRDRALSLGGLCLILVLLTGLAFLFRLVTG